MNNPFLTNNNHHLFAEAVTNNVIQVVIGSAKNALTSISVRFVSKKSVFIISIISSWRMQVKCPVRSAMRLPTWKTLARK